MNSNFYSELSQFLIQHWQLSIAFLAVLGVWIGFELRFTFNGIPRLSPQAATLLINRESPIILDIRDNTRFAKSHIQGAMNIPIVDLAQGNGKLEQHKDKTILLICEQGLQSGQAAQTLHKQGYQKLAILKGGMNAWIADSLPVAKGNR